MSQRDLPIETIPNAWNEVSRHKRQELTARAQAIVNGRLHQEGLKESLEEARVIREPYFGDECTGDSSVNDEPLPTVEGREMFLSHAEFERACQVLLAEEQRKSDANTALIDILCEAVRLSRARCDSVTR